MQKARPCYWSPRLVLLLLLLLLLLLVASPGNLTEIFAPTHNLFHGPAHDVEISIFDGTFQEWATFEESVQEALSMSPDVGFASEYYPSIDEIVVDRE